MAHMDVVDAVNQSNLILPAGDMKMGPYEYYVYSNSLVNQVKDLNDIPIKTVGNSWVTVGDVGKAEDANQIQYNMVRVDARKSCYIPIMKQGGDTNSIEVVDGVRDLIGRLFDIPKQMIATLVFDQSVYVKEAIKRGFSWWCSPLANLGVTRDVPVALLTWGDVCRRYGLLQGNPMSARVGAPT